MKTRPAPTLTAAIVGFVALGAILAAAGSWYLVTTRSAQFRQDAQAEAVTVRARGLALDFARTLRQEWRNARTIADDIARRETAVVRSALDLVVGDGTRVSWAGIADIEGQVLTSSGGLLEGRDVSQRPWFQRGLEGDFAGDVHEAVLLAQLLPAQDGEPRRFLDLATPVRSQQGDIAGVLGLHLDHGWAANYLRETATALEVDAFVINREGVVVIGTDESVTGIGALPSVRAAMTGVSYTGNERWPDGQEYFATVVPQVAYEDLPSFGWSMVVRIDRDAIESSPQFAALATIGIAFGGVLVLMTIVFVQLFARPFGQLAKSAASIMRGQEVYPYESRSTAEVQTLSAAVARLQTAGSSGRPGD